MNLIDINSINLEDLKILSKKLNNEQKSLLIKLCIDNQKYDFFKNLYNSSIVSKDKLHDILVDVVKNNDIGLDINFFKHIDDTLLNIKIKESNPYLFFNGLLKNNEKEKIDKFIEFFPITTFTNFKILILKSFIHKREDNVKELIDSQDIKSSFYFCLCAMHFKKNEKLEKFILENSLDNKNYISSLKQEASTFLIKNKTVVKKEEINNFINFNIVKAFNDLILLKIESKVNFNSVVKKNKI